MPEQFTPRRPALRGAGGVRRPQLDEHGSGQTHGAAPAGRQTGGPPPIPGPIRRPQFAAAPTGEATAADNALVRPTMAEPPPGLPQTPLAPDVQLGTGAPGAPGAGGDPASSLFALMSMLQQRGRGGGGPASGAAGGVL